jgi:putative flippase GtrA
MTQQEILQKISLTFSSHIFLFVKFGIVGAVTAAIYFLVMWIVDMMLGFNYIAAVSIAYFVSTAFHFLANRHFTFNAVEDLPQYQVIRYMAMWIINYLITIIIVGVCVERFRFSPYLGVVVSVTITVFVGYFLAQFWVFKIRGGRA